MSGPAPQVKPPIIFLAGGKGTRLAVMDSSRPKPMVPVLGKPFLHWLVGHYYAQGYRCFLVSTCHLAEMIESYPWQEGFKDATFEFYREDSPLGTGGAIQKIYRDAPGLNQAWVINADTLLPGELPMPKAQADAMYTALEKSQLFDAKPNLMVEGDLVTGEGPGGRFFDGGAVLVNRSAIERYTGKVPCSFHQLLEPSMRLRKVAYAVVPGTCYDIGTPERFQRFENYLRSAAAV